MYTINETSMHNIIHAKNRKTDKLANLNEIGLILIAALTGLSLLVIFILDGKLLNALISVLVLSSIGGYIWRRRQQRLKDAARFDQTTLGLLDNALSNVKYMIRLNRSFTFWFLLPAFLLVLYFMLQKESEIWKWVLILGCFPLAFALVRLELKKFHLPKKRQLESLRDKLTEEVSEES